MNLLLAASSPDGSLAAIKVPSTSSSRHLIQVYQVAESSTTLQLTLVHTSPLPLLQFVFAGTSSILGLFGYQEVVVWDLNRGVISAKLSVSEGQTFLALAANNNDGVNSEEENKYYALTRDGQKLLVQEYQSSNNKLIRKIKSGRGMKDLASLIVTSSHVVVRTEDSGIRIMDKDSGKKLGKIKIKSSSLSSSQYGEAYRMGMSDCIGNSKIVAAFEDAGDVALYNLDSCSEVARLPLDSAMPQQAGVSSGLQLIAQTKKDSFTLLRSDSIYSVVSGKSPRYEKVTQISTNHPVALFLKSSCKILALVHLRYSEYGVHWIQLSSGNHHKLPVVYDLDHQQGPNDKNNSASATTKRKPSESKVLGPGQAGMETVMPIKKIKLSAEDDGDERSFVGNGDGNSVECGDDKDESKNLTIAERLQMLTDALDDEENDDDVGASAAIAVATGKTKFKSLMATTESLKELLTQALQSSDDSLLELALSVHDVTTIATTINQMNEDLLVILLGKLTSRLASSPLRAEALSVWISHCLKRGSFDSEHLAVLRNMLYERIESFSDLLRLEGRLSMMID